MDTPDPSPELLTAQPSDEPSAQTVEPTRSSDEPNPFWSERATEEFRIRQARPLGLAEYDDEHVEPQYYGSEAGNSAGFASAAGPSVRGATTPRVLTGEARSEARASDSASNGPSLTSRSRSPVREELATFRDLLVSLGGAVSTLVEEHRNTQERLARVEEVRSGSTSSMRTGRERGDSDGGYVGHGFLEAAPQHFAIGDEELAEPRGLCSGMLPIEDWVQGPIKLEDIPRDSMREPMGEPETYGPRLLQVSQGLHSAQVGARSDFGSQGLHSAQVGARSDFGSQGLHSVQVGARSDFDSQGFHSAQVGARSDFGSQGLHSPQVGARSDFDSQGFHSAQVGARSDFDSQGLHSAQVGARSDFDSQGLHSAQVGARSDFDSQGLHSAKVGAVGARSDFDSQGLHSAQVGARSDFDSQGLHSAQAGARVGAIEYASVTPREGPVVRFDQGAVFGRGAQNQDARLGPSVRVCGEDVAEHRQEVRLDQLAQMQAQGSSRAFQGSLNCDGEGGISKTCTVWVDGVPRVAVMGSRGLEVQAIKGARLASPFDNQGLHFGVASEPCATTSPPPPPLPPARSEGWLGLSRSPMTPNGTRVPQEPPPADNMQWPDWAQPLGETSAAFQGPVSPPPLPPEMRGVEGAGKPEEPSRAVTELPELPGFTPQEGSVLAGDWITQLGPVVGSLSATSNELWSQLLREAYRLYSRWLSADPVSRLAIRAEANAWSGTSAKHVLIEQRLTVLLMRSVPSEIRSELVAVRAMSPLAVLVAVLTRYQPGGPNERANVLAFLVSPDRPSSVEGGIATCRRWLRQLQRAKELNLMLPDATLLIKGADSLMGQVLTKSQQSVFRLNSFRNERKLDYMPNFESIVAFGQLILAEYELLQHSEPSEPRKPKINKMQEGEEEPQPKGGKGKQGHGKSGGVDPSPGKGGKAGSANKDSGRAPCKYWCITDMGCVKASKCPDAHNKDLLKGTARCWACSSTQHQKQDCPRLQKEGPEEASSKGKGGKSKSEAKEDEAAPVLAPSAQQLLQDTAALLKNLRINKVGECTGKSRALLDSGATACMRTAKPGEILGLPERTVQLAQGEVKLRVNAGGTLLTSADVDPIVSLHKLCQVGYRVDWSRDGGCQVRAPGRNALKVYMDGGCPEVDRQVGLALIQEIEAFQARNASALRALRTWEQNGEPQATLQEALKALPLDPSLAMQWLSKKFPSLPSEVLARIPVASNYDASRVAWNRRQRRTWMRSKAVALHLFSGPQKKFWELPRQNAHCVCVDIKENLLDDQTYAFLQSMALRGQLCAVFGGPPCRTFSLSRHMPPGLPRPLRGRTLASQWGFDYLTPSERELVLTDGVLMFRMVWLYLIAETVAEELQRPKPFFGLEHPKDPETWACPKDLGFTPPTEGLASCWALKALQDFASEHALHFWHFDQGPLGHERRKPTTILASIPPPPDVQVSGSGHGMRSSLSPDAGSWPLTAWAAWAPGLKDIIRREVLSVVDAWSSERCNALREQENFLRHVVQGHVDFRRDCAACLAGAARGSRHNRRSVHDAWVLHVDLMGPFMEGADEHGNQVCLNRNSHCAGLCQGSKCSAGVG